MNKIGFVILTFVTVVILYKANKARQVNEPCINYHHNNNSSTPDDLYNAANPATAVGDAFTNAQKRQLAQKSNLHKERLVQNYISRFKKTALREAELYNIPASIKLAQGIIESNAGQSKLARKENNHFGIKCIKKRLKCKCAVYADDSPTDRFRVFSDAWSSYREHSLLLNKDRYKHLQKLNPHDYKGWAYGLQKAGYATNPNYAKLLISIIEKYQLHRIH